MCTTADAPAQETAAPWLLLAEEDTLGAFDDTLKMNALACLLSSAIALPLVGAAAAAAVPKSIAPEALALLRGALSRCSREERVRLRLSFLRVLPGDDDAAAWARGATPVLMSPRSPARRPVTFINLRPAPIDVIWIGFDGEERRYTRAHDNVDSTVRPPVRVPFGALRVLTSAMLSAPQIQPGRSTSWSSVVGHMWRVRAQAVPARRFCD
jgi:hypothetical protein